jgi:exodeoxyribonuclease V gamma subunit
MLPLTYFTKMLSVNPPPSPVLRLYTSNRMELLADALAETVGHPFDSPLSMEIIVVPNRGMARWLSMQLADRFGIWGNTKFLFPDHFAGELFRLAFPDLPEGTFFNKELLPWKIMSVLSDELLRDERMEPLAAYLSDGRPSRKFLLACKIADAFDQYTIFRPDVVLGWEAGEEDHWQAILWRTIIRETGMPHRGRLQRDFLSVIGRLPAEIFPPRISVFGLSLPPYHTALLAAVASLLPVHLFVLNPCAEFWDQIVSENEEAHIVRRELPHSDSEKTLHLEEGNPLLAALGIYGREFFSMLHDYDPQEVEIFSDNPPATLLETIQADMLHLYDRGSSPEIQKIAISATDRSIEVHSCHTPQREIEALYDYLLDVFDTNASINPSDILVMTPNIVSYAPMIRAVFGAPENPDRRIPYSLTDLTVGSEGGIINAFMALLSIPVSRFEAGTVLSLLETSAIRAAFDLSETDLPTLRTWVRRCGIRWGLDEEMLRELDLPAMPDNTWKAGIRRLLLGYALPTGDSRTFDGSAGFDDIEGTQAALAGKFLDSIEKLAIFSRKCRTARSLTAWSLLFGDLVNSFFAPDAGGEDEMGWIREAITELSQPERHGIPSSAIDYETIRHYIMMRLNRVGSNAPFLSGGVTFCAMMPMRSIPFKIICCIGMNDGAFPRQSYRPSWDLMAQHSRRGDRSLAREDRYLFLEAILSARQRLYISYIGRSARDNAVIGPSVVVEELLSTIDRGFYPQALATSEGPCVEGSPAARGAVIVEHPLQAWNPRCFNGGNRLHSFSDANAASAGSLALDESIGYRFCTLSLPPRQEEKRIALQMFIGFFRNPTRFLLINRLGIKLPERQEQVADTECFGISCLNRYIIALKLIEDMLGRSDREAAYALLKARGELPQGNVGRFEFDALAGEIRAFAESLRPFIEKEPALPPLSVDASFGPLVITGSIDDCYPAMRLTYRFADAKPNDYLAAWISHLLLCAIGKPGFPTKTLLFAKDKTITLEPVSGAESELEKLAVLFETGMCSPLPFFPHASFDYAESVLMKKRSPQVALFRAAETYHGNNYVSGEGEDPYYSFCWRQSPLFDAAWERLALDVWSPFLHSIRKEG